MDSDSPTPFAGPPNEWDGEVALDRLEHQLDEYEKLDLSQPTNVTKSALGLKSWAAIGAALADCLFSASAVQVAPLFPEGSEQQSQWQKQSSRLLEAITATQSALQSFNDDPAKVTPCSKMLGITVTESLERLRAPSQQFDDTSSEEADNSSDESKEAFGDGESVGHGQCPNWESLFDEPVQTVNSHTYAGDDGKIRSHARQLYLLSSYCGAHNVAKNAQSALDYIASSTSRLVKIEDGLKSLEKRLQSQEGGEGDDSGAQDQDTLKMRNFVLTFGMNMECFRLPAWAEVLLELKEYHQSIVQTGEALATRLSELVLASRCTLSQESIRNLYVCQRAIGELEVEPEPRGL